MEAVWCETYLITEKSSEIEESRLLVGYHHIFRKEAFNWMNFFPKANGGVDWMDRIGRMKSLVQADCGGPNALVNLAQNYGASNQRLAPIVKNVDKAVQSGFVVKFCQWTKVVASDKHILRFIHTDL
ncbi:hypothetical protein DICVIV_08351 [Dictyocaulus viviparus]|uniref:Uncharacterized protein n=1 Tax=Dictyocaulus viviparus TaxID=29172 RepID=A0A0D8XM38_DICVI|nr:hypothetical protein DICVIV_08351 [Dictyocaulus viviparus]